MHWQEVDQLSGDALDWAYREALDRQSPVCAGLSDEQKRERVREEFGEHLPVPDELVSQMREK